MTDKSVGALQIPDNEEKRLQVLSQYLILNTPPEEPFTGLVQLAAKVFNLPMCSISLVDKEKVFFKAAYGFGEVQNIDKSESICVLAVYNNESTIFEDLTQQPYLLSMKDLYATLAYNFMQGHLWLLQMATR